jgi:hypothetical protein
MVSSSRGSNMAKEFSLKMMALVLNLKGHMKMDQSGLKSLSLNRNLKNSICSSIEEVKVYS